MDDHLNSNIDSWGLKQDASKDVGDLKYLATSAHSLEYFTMVFEKTAGATS
jgi:hypothetical protein